MPFQLAPRLVILDDLELP